MAVVSLSSSWIRMLFRILSEGLRLLASWLPMIKYWSLLSAAYWALRKSKYYQTRWFYDPILFFPTSNVARAAMDKALACWTGSRGLIPVVPIAVFKSMIHSGIRWLVGTRHNEIGWSDDSINVEKNTSRAIFGEKNCWVRAKSGKNPSNVGQP